MANKTDNYIMFSLQDQGYAINISKAKAVIDMAPISPIPKSPDFVKGVIEYMGKPMPVVDFGLRLGLLSKEYTRNTSIIVVEVSDMELPKCWEKMKCNETRCPAFENKERRCWIISRTHCRNEIQGNYYQKIEACKKCNVYKTAQKCMLVYHTGVIVDSVSDVISIESRKIMHKIDKFSFASELKHDFISGIVEYNKSFIILVNTDSMFNF